MRFQHQTEVFNESWDKSEWALFLETGTGKTAIIIDTAVKLYKTRKIRAVVVVAPKTVYRGVWTRQIGQFCDVDHMVVSWSPQMSMDQQRRFNSFIQNTFQSDKLIWFLINVESFSTQKVFNPLIRFFSTYVDVMMVIDESARIKNVKALRTKNLLRIAPMASYKRIMSGFPVLNSPEDLYSQILFLGGHHLPYASFYAFRNYYANLRNSNEHVQIATSYKNLDHLTGILQKFSSRRLKQDCLDLPDKVYEPRMVNMSPEQSLLYRTMRDKGFAELSKLEVVTAANFLVQAGKLHQIASGLLMSSTGTRHIENGKYDALMEILEDEVSGSVAIAATYTENVRRINSLIQERYGPRQCSAIEGSVGINERERAIERFQSGKQRFLVINPSTVREGIDLFFGHTCVFFNNSFHLDYRIQFEDRFHRIGQTNKVTYIDLLTEDTVDSEVLSALMDKQEVGSMILGDAWKRWFK